MSESPQVVSAASLAEYRRALRQVRPSPNLDERVAASIDAYAPLNGMGETRRLSWRSFTAGAVAAAAAAAIAIGLGLRSQAPSLDAGHIAAAPRVIEPLAAPILDAQWGEASPWAGDASIVRVRGTLVTEPGETQYWVDVRLGADGSMRIVKVIPVNPANNGSM